MAQEIDSDKLLVREVFSKWFRIPEYQRPYVWETDQVTELLNDVMYAQTTNPEAQYFLGSLVLQKKEKEEGSTKYTEYDLLDGQQRLTTLLLITAVVRDLTPTTNQPRIKTTTESIFQMANPDDNVPERLRIVFDTREEVRDFVGEATFKFIQRYYDHYLDLFDRENYNLTGSFELYNQLMLMQKGFEAGIWVAPLLRYYDKFKTNSLVEFAKKLDNKFANDWLIGLYPTYRIENINKIIQCIDDSANHNEVLQHASLLINSDELMAILDGPIYGRRAAKYVMLKLDLLFLGNTSKFSIPETISIEHILPQYPPEVSQWRNDFSDEERLQWTHRLGNLVLISRRKNTAQGNRDYTDKKTRYFKGNIELFSNSIRIFHQFPTWKPDDLKKNHEEVLLKIKSSFGFHT